MALCKSVHTADMFIASLWNAWNTNYGNCSMCIELPTHHKLIAMHASDSVILS